jgi:hypothetical protein
MRRRIFAAGIVTATVAACGADPHAPAAAPVGQCAGQDRPQLDCSTEVQYNGTDAKVGVNFAGFGGASGDVQQKALREIDKQTGLYIAEARRLCDEYNKCVIDKDTYATRSENMRRRVAQAPELLDGLKNAQGDDAKRLALSKAYRTLVPDDARTEVKLNLSVLAQRPTESVMAPLAAGGSVPTGSRLAFVVDVSQPSYVYLFQKAATGSVDVLFPDTRIPVNNPIPASTTLRIPQGTASFKLDDKDIGTESVYVVVSLHPVSKLAAAADQARAGSAPTGALAQVTAIDTGCSRQRSLSLDTDAPPEGGCVRSRGLSLDDPGAPASPAVAAPASLHATSEAADDTIATVFRFEHTR